MKIWYRKFRFKFIRNLVEVLTSKTSDSAIAFGFAVGTFIALLPTPGLNWVLAFCMALLFKKINKLSLFFAIVFWNPLFMAPVYALCYVVGDFLFNVFHLEQWESLLPYTFVSHSGKFLLGNIILTSIISVLGFHLALKVVLLYKNRREKKKLKEKKKPESTLLLIKPGTKLL